MERSIESILNHPHFRKHPYCALEYLSKYLKVEDIDKLNYPEILEEVLRKADYSKLYCSEVLEEILRKVDASSLSSRPCSSFTRIKSYFHSFINNKSLKFRIIAIGSAVVFILVCTSNSILNIVGINKGSNLQNNVEYAQLTSNSRKQLSQSSQNVHYIAKNLSLPLTSTNAINIAFAKNKKQIANKILLASRSKSPVRSGSGASFSEYQNMDPSDIISQSKKKLFMIASAYDLSYKSCSKTREHPAYGITYTGTRATFGRTIAVDPAVIPLGSKVYISFPEKYKHMDGVYIAEDTGSLIKGNKVDIFFGEDKPGELIVHNKANKFGLRKVIVYLLD